MATPLAAPTPSSSFPPAPPPRSSKRPVSSSTPIASGPSIHSEYSISEREAQVLPLLEQNLNSAMTCNIYTMLQGLLSKVTRRDGLTVDDLVNKYTQSIARDEFITQQLMEYGEKGKENQFYRPFVLGMNRALQLLSEIDDQDLLPLPSQEDHIMFHVEDPRLVEESENHPRASFKTKPDVILIPLSAAQEIHGNEPLKWEDIALSRSRAGSALPKGRHVHYKHTLVSTEFKRKNYDKLDPVEIRSGLHIAAHRQFVTGLDNNDMHPSSMVQSTSTEEHALLSAHLGTKRKRSQATESNRPDKRKKPTGLPIAKAIQSVVYATERLTHGVCCTHSISLLIEDTVVWVLWCDAQGAIQAQGFNMNKSLPYFLVLLLIFQRFRSEDWGIHPRFIQNRQTGTVQVDVVPAFGTFEGSPDRPIGPLVQHTCEINEGSDQIDLRFCMKGRGTRVNHCKVSSSHAYSGDTELIAKFSWPEISRQSEIEILTEVHRLAKECKHDDERIRNHIPELFYTFEDPSSSTANTRELFGVPKEKARQGARVLRGLVFRRLHPITELKGKAFFQAFFQVFACHYALWRRGVQHRDISPQNLMYKRVGRDTYGVLIDFDLARIHGSEYINFQRMGTLPFMALDLLLDSGIAGEIVYQYRHDAESFGWVLLWVVYQFCKGKEMPRDLGPFPDWLEGIPDKVRSRKTGCIGSIMNWTRRLETNPELDHLRVAQMEPSEEDDVMYHGANAKQLASFWVSHSHGQYRNVRRWSEKQVAQAVLKELRREVVEEHDEVERVDGWHPLIPQGIMVFHDSDDKL